MEQVGTEFHKFHADRLGAAAKCGAGMTSTSRQDMPAPAAWAWQRTDGTLTLSPLPGRQRCFCTRSRRPVLLVGFLWFLPAFAAVLDGGCSGTTSPDNTLPSTVEDDGEPDSPDDPNGNDNGDDGPGPIDDPNDDNGQPDGPLDTDGDGFPDDDEVNGVPGTDPFDATDNPDDVRDTDGDGCSDFDELNFAGFCNNDPNTPDDGDEPTPDGAVSIGGGVSVSATAVVDGDTNDPNNPLVDNNAEDPTRVQSLPNPCTLGGYLGITALAIDVNDAYRVSMAAGQTASLLLADPTVSDFDLYLYDESGNPLASSEGVGKAEQVSAPSNGTFIVEVYGYSVANDFDPGGLYTLLIGDDATAAAATGRVGPRERLSSLCPFVEGEILARYRKDAVRAMSRRIADDVELDVLNAAADSGGVERLRVRSKRSTQQKQGAAASVLQRPTSETINVIKQLRRRDDVVYAEPNYVRRPLSTPNDEFFPFQWHYTQIGLPEAWDVTTGSSDVIVAVIDTGVVSTHPDLQGQFVDGYDFIADPAAARDGDGIDADPTDAGDLAIQGTVSSFHGTHVAGTVAAHSNNGTGVAGVAWNVRVMPVRVLGQGGGTDFDITQGIRYAAGLSNVSGQLPERRADVINLSLGGPGISITEQETIEAARNAGVIVVAAAGNESSNADFSSPAGLEGVVTVSAVGYTGEAASYSNFGSCVDVAAPGGDLSADANGDTYPDGVLSTMSSDDGGFTYEFSDGTSMAAPHVAGVAALMKSVNPDLTPDDFDLLMAGEHPGTTISITDDSGPAGRDSVYGYGLINAFGAVQAAGDIIGVGAVSVPVIKVRPRDVEFGSTLSSASVTVQNVGVGELEVTGVTSNASWLTASPTSGGEGAYTLTVDRSGLDDGVYSGSVDFASNGGTTSVSVRMTVGDQVGTGGDIGAVYVLLLDVETSETVAQDIATASDGYTFAFTQVPPGEYGLFAGTDMDNNGYISNEGEAVGGYPTLRDSEMLDAYQDRSGLSFSVSFLINVQAPTAVSVRGKKLLSR